MQIAAKLEDTYQRYRHLRDIAISVYAPKLEEYENPDYETVCTAILFEYDQHNQARIAQRLGVSVEQLRHDLACLSTGARLLKQGK
jgi:hypothetical protein